MKLVGQVRYVCMNIDCAEPVGPVIAGRVRPLGFGRPSGIG